LELKKIMAIEREIDQLAPLHHLGTLCLDMQELKSSLKSEATAWKNQFAENLHKGASRDLKVRVVETGHSPNSWDLT
jgi:dynein heavy chain, axonemal